MRARLVCQCALVLAGCGLLMFAVLSSMHVETVEECRLQCGHWRNASYTDFSASGFGTCSKRASSRGSNQSVISFTFHGEINSGRNYFQGIQENIELLPKQYPGYQVRVYHDLVESYAVSRLCEVYCTYQDVLDICYVGDIPGFGNLLATHQYMWRFLPLVDPQVNVFLSRDLDSRFSERETAAVQEWLQSERPLHAMRDHLSHKMAIMGGMWGARVQDHLAVWRAAFDEMMQKLQNTRDYQQDQFVLRDVVYAKYATRPGFLLAHDSYYCRDEEYLRGEVRPFPTQRRNESVNFVGSVKSIHGGPMLNECPLPCRKNPEWKFC